MIDDYKNIVLTPFLQLYMQCEDTTARFTTVPLKPTSYQKCER